MKGYEGMSLTAVKIEHEMSIFYFSIKSVFKPGKSLKVLPPDVIK